MSGIARVRRGDTSTPGHLKPALTDRSPGVSQVKSWFLSSVVSKGDNGRRSEYNHGEAKIERTGILFMCLQVVECESSGRLGVTQGTWICFKENVCCFL